MPSHLKRIALALSLLLFMSGHALAQAARTGRLIVTVVDPLGGVVQAATVSISGLEDATKRVSVAPLKTTDRGVATFENLALGRYSLRAEFSGFDPGVVGDFQVRAGDNRRTLGITLGRMADSVTVAGEADADRGSLFGTTLTRAQLDALSDDPAELRRQLEDMAGPGAVIAVDSFEGAQLPPKSQIRSVRISRDQFAAESHAAGLGRIEILTQPGLGPITANMSFSFNDSALDGRNPLVGQRGPAQTRSGNVGLSGGLLKDKLSFSVSLSGNSAYSTPVQYAATSTGQLTGNTSLRAPTSFYGLYGSMDYAMTRDQTLRMNFNVNGNRNNNQGVGTYDLQERAYSTATDSFGLYVQQTGPVGRRLVLNSRYSLNWSDSTSTSAVERPTLIVQDNFTSGGAQRAGGTHTRFMNISSDLDYVRGRHSVRVGVAVDASSFRSDSRTNYLGTYTFESLEAFDAGKPRSYQRRIGDPNIEYSNVQVAVYIQDDIRPRRNLSLSPGLRYEVQSHVGDRADVAPRFGFTWSPFASGKTTLRSSIGVFYDWLATGTYQQTLQIDGVRQQEITLNQPFYPDPGELGTAPPVNKYLLANDVRLARNTRASVGISQVLLGTRLTVGSVYAFSRGTGLLVGENLNSPVGGARPEPEFANIVLAVPDGRNEQQSVNTNASLNLSPPQIFGAMTGRYIDWRRGLRITVNHTWSKIRNNTDGAFSAPASGDLALEWGPGAGDVRHRTNLSFVTNFIRNAQASFSLNASTAPPLTIRTGFDDNGDSIFNDRPAGVGRNSARTSGQWTSSAFFGYSFSVGSKQTQQSGGIQITSVGGGTNVNMTAAQSVPRYRFGIAVNVSNLTNHANFSGHSGVMTSAFFLKPTNAIGYRRVTAQVGVTF